jgi:type IV pilus assembly protein PilX
MVNLPQNPKRVQTGIVLVSSLLLLLVVTIMALSIFRSFGLQERIAGNTRDKQRALQVAVSVQQYAELWIANSSSAPVAVANAIASSADFACSFSATTANAMSTAPQICTNNLASFGASVTSPPWVSGGNYLGFQYTPPGMGVSGGATGIVANDIVYSIQPAFYITDLGAAAGSLVPGTGSTGEVYKIDAYGSGVSPTTLAVVESTVVVSCIVCKL